MLCQRRQSDWSTASYQAVENQASTCSSFMAGTNTVASSSLRVLSWRAKLHAVDQMLFPSPAGFSSCTKCSACLLSFHVNIFFFLVLFCLITRCNKSSTMQYSPRWLLASCSDSSGSFKLDLTDHNGCGQPVQCEVKAIIQADIFKCN